MIRDIRPFEEFLSSLSHISQLNFEVWNTGERVFSSGVHQPKASISREVQKFSARVITQAAFQHASLQGHYAVFGIPIKNETQVVIGSLIAHGSDFDKKSQPKDITPSTIVRAREMKTFLTHLVSLMEETWSSQNDVQELAEELTQSFEDIYLYSRIAPQIKTFKFSKTMLETLLSELLETMRIDVAFAKLPERQEYDTLISGTTCGARMPDMNRFADNLIGSIPGSAPAFEEDYFIVNDSTSSGEFRELSPDPYRFLAVKIQHNENFYGWLGLVSWELKEIFRRSELRLLSSMAEQVAVIIANTDLYSDLQHFVINMVKSLVYAIEAKDKYTRGHSERVNRYCMIMAGRLGLEAAQKDILNWTSTLHDVGKIGIPETILNKPGGLSDEEYGTVKTHPEKGCNILQPLEQLSDSLPGILHHHERYDGKGYPHRLRGEKIPLMARIVAVADTFDAITSDRPYRPARTLQEALAIMEDVAGSQLGPDLVKEFKAIVREELQPGTDGNQGR